jgi:hypothetical protein
MIVNEELVEELCTELQQLCAELDKVIAVSEESCGRVIKGQNRLDINYTTGRTKTMVRPGQQDAKFIGKERKGTILKSH